MVYRSKISKSLEDLMLSLIEMNDRLTVANTCRWGGRLLMLRIVMS